MPKWPGPRTSLQTAGVLCCDLVSIVLFVARAISGALQRWGPSAGKPLLLHRKAEWVLFHGAFRARLKKLRT